MEQVEEANRAAVESSRRVLNLLSQHPQDDEVEWRNLTSETGDAVFRFKRVVSLLNTRLGHARIRMLKEIYPPLPQSSLLDCSPWPPPLATNLENPAEAILLLSPMIHDSGSVPRTRLALGSPRFQLGSDGMVPLVWTPMPDVQYQFLQRQQIKHQAELIYRRSCNSGMNLTFDGSHCTPTMSSTRSFISPLSVDGSVGMANSDSSAFHFTSAARSLYQSVQHKRKCAMRGEDGSTKCVSTSRKHRVKRSIKVPAISRYPTGRLLMEEVWAEAHQGLTSSSIQWGYYKRSGTRGCPARKHVERCVEDTSMLVVTYEGEHNHPRLSLQ